MLLMFSLGIFIGVFMVIGLLRATMSTDPTGCISVFGSIMFVVVWLVIFVPWLILNG